MELNQSVKQEIPKMRLKCKMESYVLILFFFID